MGLIVSSSPSWTYCTTNHAATPNTNTFGTTVTSGTSHSDGSDYTLVSSLSHDVEFIHVIANGFGQIVNNHSVLLDIMTDPAGGTSFISLIDDLLVGWSSGGFSINYSFPVWIPSGSSIGARARSASGNTSDGSVLVIAMGGNANPSSWWCGQGVESVGVVAASSRGTLHTAGNSGSYSSWADLGSVLTNDCRAIQFAAHGEYDTSGGDLSYYFDFGIAGEAFGPKIIRSTTSANQGLMMPTGPIFRSIPSGTQLQIRGTCSGTAASNNLAAYCVY